MRRIFLPLSLILVALAGFGAWTLAARSGAADRATRLAPAAPVAVAALLPQRDTAAETWRLSLPPVAAQTPRTVHATVEPAPDWSAFSAGIATVPSPATATLALVTTPPAELDIVMSARERRALIASAREPESAPGPRNYRPGIVVIVPGGSGSDGVCR